VGFYKKNKETYQEEKDDFNNNIAGYLDLFS
jgi:hypothetical protein